MNSRILISPKILVGAIAAFAVVGAFIFMILSASAQEQPTITTVVRNTGGATTTSAAIGIVIRADVTIASTTGPVAASTVDFHRFPNTTCTLPSAVESNVQLINGFAQSGTTTMPVTGLSYRVHYDGETNLYVPADGECVSVTATGPNTSITTTLSTSTVVLAGASVHDTSTLHNNTANASGTVAYKVYSNNACSTLFADAGVKTVASSVVPNSDAILFNTPGTYYWQAVYSGDSLNARATSTCTSEILTVFATSTPKGHIIVDKVTNPSGATTTFPFVVGGIGYSNFNLTDQSTPNNQELNPGTYTITESSVSGWNRTSTCSKNGASSTPYTPGSNLALGANDSITCIFINTRIATGTGSISGTKYHDTDEDGVRDSGEPGLSGWTIRIFGNVKENGNWWRGFKWGFWSHEEVLATTTTDLNGNYSFTNLEPGTYIIRETKQDGWKQTSQSPAPIALVQGQVVTGINFGNAMKPSEDDDDDEDGDDDDDDRERGNRPERPQRGAGRDDDNDNDHATSGLGSQIVDKVFKKLHDAGISIGDHNNNDDDEDEDDD